MMQPLPSRLACGLAWLCLAAAPAAAQTTFSQVIDVVQPKMVKVYGAGGLRGLEAYQSGFLISDTGHVLTVWSYVLDTEYVTVTLDDGRKFEAALLGADPRLELAVLKIDAEGLDHFDLGAAVELETGDRVLAFSNLYGVATGDEPASVLHGIVTAQWSLSARRGTFETPYRGPVYVVDAMTNNPGAAGGALTDRQGNLAAVLGKELKNSLNNTWLNYGIPIAEVVEAVQDIRDGKVRPRTEEEEVDKPDQPHTLAELGIYLEPDILPKTPPFVSGVRAGSPAERAGIRSDDLVLFVNDRIVASCNRVRDELSYVDRIDELRLTVQRGQELKDFVLTVEPQP